MPTTLNPNWIIGKRVVAVETVKVDGHCGVETGISAIRFDNGSRIYFVAHETDDEPYVAACYQPAARNPGA